MDDLVFRVTDALNGSPGIALVAALAWGVLSVLLSPCHLGTIPLVVGLVSASTAERPDRGDAAALSFSFAGGMVLAIALLGVAFAALGHALRGASGIANYVVAAVFVVSGLHMLDLLSLPWATPAPGAGRRKGALAALLVGLVVGLGLSPCTFAFIAPVLGLSFAGGATSPVRAVGLLLAFALAHGAVIGLAGASTGRVQRYLAWSARSRAPRVLKTACAVLVLLAAASLVYSA